MSENISAAANVRKDVINRMGFDVVATGSEVTPYLIVHYADSGAQLRTTPAVRETYAAFMEVCRLEVVINRLVQADV